VFGHEHYAGQLADLACAAVPIRYPVSGLRIPPAQGCGVRKLGQFR